MYYNRNMPIKSSRPESIPAAGTKTRPEVAPPREIETPSFTLRCFSLRAAISDIRASLSREAAAAHDAFSCRAFVNSTVRRSVADRCSDNSLRARSASVRDVSAPERNSAFSARSFSSAVFICVVSHSCWRHLTKSTCSEVFSSSIYRTIGSNEIRILVLFQSWNTNIQRN